MSKYRGLFTFDEQNHKYIPLALADGIIDFLDTADYVPVEPLIEDEKIRKAVRAWAEANDLDGASFYTSSHFWYLRAFNHREQGIDFWLKWDDKPNLIESKYYTIEELCGEEAK